MEKKTAFQRFVDFGRLPNNEKQQYWAERWREKGDPVMKVALVAEGIIKYVVAPIFLLAVALFGALIPSAKKQ